MFRRGLAAVLTGVLLICPAFASSFPDVDDTADYAEAVEFVNELGIMIGDDKGNFNPDKTVTRAEMAAIVCRMLGETEGLTTSNDFTDVPIGHWANAYIAKAVEYGIVNGYGDGRFGPSDAVTYEQAVTMVVRAAGCAGEAQELGGYPDGFLAVALEFGLLHGINAQTGDAFSRANVAILIYNLLKS